MPKKNLFYGKMYRGHKLSDDEHTFSEKYLRIGLEMVEDMCYRHCKVTQVRMDFRYPTCMQADPSNKDFKRAMNSYTKELNRKGLDPQYIAKREQRTSHNQHYHVALEVNGSKKRDRNSLIKSAEKHWGNAIGIDAEEVHDKKLVYPCNHDVEGNYRENGYLIDRNKIDYNEIKNKAIRQISYLCKKSPDDKTPSSTRKFFYSQCSQDLSKAIQKKKDWLERNKDKWR